MSETRATIRARVQQHVGGAINLTLNEAIREAHKELQRRHNWRFMEESTTINVSKGDTTVTLPSDFKEEMNPEMGNSDGTGYRRMKKIIKNGIESRTTDDEGRPLLYRIWEGQGHLYAKADMDYTFPLEYLKWLPELTSDDAPTGDNAKFVDETHKFMELMGISAGFDRLKKYKLAERWERKAEGKYLELLRDDGAIAQANLDLSMQMPG